MGREWVGISMKILPDRGCPEVRVCRAVGAQGPSAGRHGNRGIFVGVACAEAHSRQGRRRPNPSTSYRRGLDYAKGPVIRLEIPRERLVGLTVPCQRLPAAF